MRRGYEAYMGEDNQLLVNGLTMDYADNFTLRVEFAMTDVALPGRKYVGNRKGQGRITGTISGFKFSDYLMKVAMSQTTTISVVSILTNEKTKKKMKVEVRDVQFTSADLVNAQVGQPVKFELPFVADDMKDLD